MSLFLRLERKQKISSNAFPIRIFLLRFYSFGIETINTFIHSRSSLEIHTRFRTKMGKVYSICRLLPSRHWWNLGKKKLDRELGLRAKCKSLSKPNERRQNNSFENVSQRFAWSFVSFLQRKHDFRWRFLLLYDEYSSKNPEFEPLGWVVQSWVRITLC